MSNVLDPLVFDIAFADTSFFVPALLDMWVEKEFKKVALGQVVIVRARIITLAEDRRRYLFNPSTPPRLTITGPDGMVRVSNGPMQNISTGVYQYPYQTGLIFGSAAFDSNVFDTVVHDLPGAYVGFIQARDGIYDLRSLNAELFQIVRDV